MRREVEIRREEKKKDERKRKRRAEWRREGRRRLQEGGREKESDVKLIGRSLMEAVLRERR